MFLRNAWYVVGFASELQNKLLARTVIDTPIVMYRKEGGDPVALLDRCPHRFAPLSRGKVFSDAIECGYHGLRFDATGACVLNPHGNCRIPAQARVRGFPIVEKFTLHWIWMGDPDLADPDSIPDFSFLDDSLRARVDGYLHVKANYQLETDNLLDLSHTQFVHENYHFSESILRGTHEVKQEGDTVFSNLWCPNGPASPNFAKRIKASEAEALGPVDQWFDMRWDPPSNLRLYTGVTFSGKPRNEGAQSMTAHIVTPETETTSHYFFAHSREFAVNDKAMDESIAEWQRIGFGEQDRGMLEAVQERMGTTDLMSLRPILLPIDSAAVRARRVMEALLASERHASTEASTTPSEVAT